MGLRTSPSQGSFVAPSVTSWSEPVCRSRSSNGSCRYKLLFIHNSNLTTIATASLSTIVVLVVISSGYYFNQLSVTDKPDHLHIGRCRIACRRGGLLIVRCVRLFFPFFFFYFREPMHWPANKKEETYCTMLATGIAGILLLLFFFSKTGRVTSNTHAERLGTGSKIPADELASHWNSSDQAKTYKA